MGAGSGMEACQGLHVRKRKEKLKKKVGVITKEKDPQPNWETGNHWCVDAPWLGKFGLHTF